MGPSKNREIRRLTQSVCLLGIVILSACASSVPPNRLIDYVGAREAGQAETLATLQYQRPLRAGLILVPDTADPKAAPSLPDEALNRLAEQLQQDINRVLPVEVSGILPADGINPARSDGSMNQFVELGRKQGLDYIALVIVSSTEQEYPVSLFLGWTTHMQPGFRRDNWSLLEFALLDLKRGRVLLQAEGRGWATLDSPTAPGINQWYPVVYLRPNDPVRRFWPPTFEGAPNTLRVVAVREAAKRLTLGIQDAWIAYLQEQGAATSKQS